MHKLIGVIASLYCMLAGTSTLLADELDDFWAEASRTVAEGDFDGYKATFHPDAVFVSGPKKISYPISTAFARWKKGFEDTASGKMKAGVEFRFAETFRDETTAHQVGMFKYHSVDENGELFTDYMHFSALLSKNENWQVIMEFQKSSGTAEDWDALGN